VVSIAGTQYTIEVAVNFPLDGSGYATQATDYNVYTAGDVGFTVSTDPGFNGEGENIHIANSGTHHFVRVYVHTDHSYPMSIYVNGSLITNDVTNHGVDASF
jgi:hypothetical protein